MCVGDFWRGFARARGIFLRELLSKVATAARSALIEAGYRKCIYDFFRFEASYNCIYGMSAGIGSNWHVPWVNKTKGSPFISHFSRKRAVKITIQI